MSNTEKVFFTTSTRDLEIIDEIIQAGNYKNRSDYINACIHKDEDYIIQRLARYVRRKLNLEKKLHQNG